MDSDNQEVFFPDLSPVEKDLLCQNYSVDDGEAILVVTIDIGDGRKDAIKAYEHDDSDQLALDFCHKHKLGARAKILLADEIEKYLKVAISKLKVISANTQRKSGAATNKDRLSQSPTRQRRNQTFTQKSMQLKQNIIRDSYLPNGKPATSVSTKFSSGQDSPDSIKLKSRSPSRNFKPQTSNITYQQSEAKKKPKEFLQRSTKRYNSLYSKETFNRGGSVDLPEEDSLPSFSPSRSVWVPDSYSRLDCSEDSTPIYASPSISNNSVYKNSSISQSKSIGTEKTERIMKKIKYQRYKEIFAMLSPNTKGVITSETVDKSAIPAVIRKILTPLIEELEELSETLDFNEFYDAMEMLMRVLTPGDKSTLLLPGKVKAPEKQEFNFRPKTNVGQNSVSSLGLYERSLQKKQDFSRKIQREKELKQENEMKECKFSPSIIANHRKTMSNNTYNGISSSYDP